MTDLPKQPTSTRTTGLGPKAQKLQALREKAARQATGTKPDSGTGAQSFTAKTTFAGKKTNFQRKAT